MASGNSSQLTNERASFESKTHDPEQVVKTVMGKLNKRGKGIMHHSLKGWSACHFWATCSMLVFG
jgi:hypothetical protein